MNAVCQGRTRPSARRSRFRIAPAGLDGKPAHRPLRGTRSLKGFTFMLTSISLCVHHSTKIRKLGLDRPRVDFEPGYNAVIGPNGSGKSTLLKAIASCDLCRPEMAGEREGIRYVTTETLNPLAGGSFSSREEMVQAIRSMFRSHGQGVLDSLRSQSHADETIVLVDSPETGQDHRNSELIHEGLLRMAGRYQVIVATNSLVFMRGGNLIDLGEESLPRLVGATRELLTDFESSAEHTAPREGKQK